MHRKQIVKRDNKGRSSICIRKISQPIGAQEN